VLGGNPQIATAPHACSPDHAQTRRAASSLTMKRTSETVANQIYVPRNGGAHAVRELFVDVVVLSKSQPLRSEAVRG